MERESSIERQILDYLNGHPTAEDTLRGVVEWWLVKQRIAESTAEVETALARLVMQGKLSADTGVDGQMRYHLPERTQATTRDAETNIKIGQRVR